MFPVSVFSSKIDEFVWTPELRVGFALTTNIMPLHRIYRKTGREFSKTVRVNAVRGLNSDLVEMKSGSDEYKITTGWRAEPFKNRTTYEIPVQLCFKSAGSLDWKRNDLD